MAFVEKRKRDKGNTWRVRWQDPAGNWHSDTFGSAAAAKAKKAAVETEVTEAKEEAADWTVAELCDAYTRYFDAIAEEGIREKSSAAQYRQHVAHVKADKAFEKLAIATLKAPAVQGFLDRLLASGVSRPLTAKIRTSLGSIVRWGQTKGYISHNPVEPTKLLKVKRKVIDEDQDGPCVIPSQDELRQLLDAADRRHNTDQGYAAALVRVLLFCGLRISEVRGLCRRHVKLAGDKMVIRVVQRADRYQQLGAPKSETSRRVVPVGADTARALRVWMATSDAGEKDLLFPNGAGNVESYANIWNRVWVPLCGTAGIADPIHRIRKERNTGEKKPVESWKPRYGIHSMRHAYASILIAQGTTPKKVMELMGHSTIKLTMDTYGHLWPNDVQDTALASAAEKFLMQPQA